MDFGIAMFPTDYAMRPADLARAAEERDFESLWFPEHSHIPTSRKSPWPGGGELPKMYYDTYDPFVALATAASVTSRIKLATGICLVVQRDPIHLAKEVASLDQLSDGRVLLGVGGGWNAEEMEDHGTAFATRFKLMRERIEAMKAIWSEKEAEYHGEFVDFGPMMQWPKPVQKPHPPIIVGGGFPHGARRAVAYGDGWMPIGGRGADLLEQIRRTGDLARQAGREIGFSVFGAPVKPQGLAELAEVGVTRCVFAVPPEPAESLLPRLDDLAALARQFNG